MLLDDDSFGKSLVSEKVDKFSLQARLKKFFWVEDALKALDYASFSEGNTPLILAAMRGDVKILYYILV